jgi:hypothetical protein
MQKKDKEKILDEVWTEDRIKSFLNLLPPTGIDADFHALNTAYKSMRLEDFEIFLGFFIAHNRKLSATNPQGQTATDIMKQHRYGIEYAKLLESV